MDTGGACDGIDEVGRYQRARAVVDEDDGVPGTLGQGGDARGHGILATLTPRHDGRDDVRQPGRRRDLADPGAGRDDHDVGDAGRAGHGFQRPGQERAAADHRRKLVRAAHPGAGAGRHHDRVGHRPRPGLLVAAGHSGFGWAKIMRPATVCSTRVTPTSISRSR